jgi:hypothetical protein
VRFVETPVSTERIKNLLPDEDYRALQIALELCDPNKALSSRVAAGCARSAGRRKESGSEEAFE